MPEMTERNASPSEHWDEMRMEDEGGAHRSEDAQSAELAKLEIIPVNTTIYRWGDYLYTNAHDALAAAKRGKK